MSGPIPGEQRHGGDDGSASPEVTAVLAAYAAGRASERSALLVLASSRLLVPLVAMPASAGGGHGPGHRSTPGRTGDAGPGPRHPSRRAARERSEMATPTLVGRDGRHAALAFTCLDALARWRPDARPVPVPAATVWQTGARDAEAVVVDVAGPVPLEVDGARLAALAAGQPPPSPHADPDVAAAARAAFRGEALLTAFVLHDGADGSDLLLEVTLAGGAQAGERAVAEAIERAVGRLIGAAGERLRRGVAVAVVGGSAPCCAG